MGRLDGRVALVTGASRGFGRAIARALGRAGADLAINYCASGVQAEEVAAEVRRKGRRAEALRADVAREEEVQGAVSSFTKAMARECGPYGITVNAIAPGSIETDMSQDVMTEEFKARRIQELPVRRMGTVEDVAHVAVFLASEESGFLTGQVIHASGGLVM